MSGAGLIRFVENTANFVSTEAVEKLWIAPSDPQGSRSKKEAYRVLHNQAASTDSQRRKTFAVTAESKGDSSLQLCFLPLRLCMKRNQRPNNFLAEARSETEGAKVVRLAVTLSFDEKLMIDSQNFPPSVI